MKFVLSTLFLSTAVTLFSCSDSTTSSTASNTDSSSAPATNDTAMNIKEETVNYTSDGNAMTGFVAFNENVIGKRPVVLVVPEWWGLNDYPKMRARELAKLGYLAMAVDMYGGGKVADNPKDAQALATPFYQNPQLTKTRLDAALQKAKEYSQADTSKVAAIGYCYGGFVVLNAAKLGANLKGVVSFHGNLSGVPPTKDFKTKVLVCHGEADQFVSPAEVAAFKKSMDSVSADYTFKTYPNATHAFTNPASTETGKKFNMPIQYNGAADTASWNDMKNFFSRVIPK